MHKSTGNLYLLILYLSLFLFTTTLSAQNSDTLFYDSFEDISNWTPVGPQGLQSWEMSNSNNAFGLAAPEIRFNWIYPFIGESYLLGNPVFYGLQGHNMELKFNYYEDWWSNIVYVGVAITGDGGITYNSIWELQASGNSGPDLVTVDFTGIDNMQVALYYLGDSNDIDFWYVDDFTLIDLDAVPVKLTSFTASIINRDVVLKWVTASETNNKGFDIQRKKSEVRSQKPGVRSQESDWQIAGFVDGHGTTTKLNTYNFTDPDVKAGTYSYRLKQTDFNGSFRYSKIVTVEVNTVPTRFSLEQNYPNPFNPSTRIKFNLPVRSRVTMNVYNVIGQKIRSVINGSFPEGNNSFTFNASGLNSGIYFYRIDAAGIDGKMYSSVKKMILAK